MWTMSSPKGLQKHSHSCSCRGCKATNHTGTLLNLPKHWNSPEPSGTFQKLPPEPTPALLRNLREVASGTYTKPPRTFRKLPPEPTQAHTGTVQNLDQHTLEPSGTFRKLFPEPTPAHTRTLRNPWNLPPEPTPAQTGTLRNLPPEPTPAHTETLQNLLEPSSGTCSSDPHRHTPELIWAEDPIGLRCWGKTFECNTHTHTRYVVCILMLYAKDCPVKEANKNKNRSRQKGTTWLHLRLWPLIIQLMWSFFLQTFGLFRVRFPAANAKKTQTLVWKSLLGIWTIRVIAVMLNPGPKPFYPPGKPWNSNGKNQVIFIGENMENNLGPHLSCSNMKNGGALWFDPQTILNSLNWSHRLILHWHHFHDFSSSARRSAPRRKQFPKLRT